MGDAPAAITPGSTGTGLLKSTDGGANWSITGLTNTAVTVVAIDPSDSHILYAAAEGIYSKPNGFRGLLKSTDSGATWFASDNELARLTGSGATITALVIPPNHSNILYAGTSEDGIYRSLDSGANWVKFHDGLASLDIRALAFAPGSPSVLYAATSAGIFKMADVAPLF